MPSKPEKINGPFDTLDPQKYEETDDAGVDNTDTGEDLDAQPKGKKKKGKGTNGKKKQPKTDDTDPTPEEIKADEENTSRLSMEAAEAIEQLEAYISDKSKTAGDIVAEIERVRTDIYNTKYSSFDKPASDEIRDALIDTVHSMIGKYGFGPTDNNTDKNIDKNEDDAKEPDLPKQEEGGTKEDKQDDLTQGNKENKKDNDGLKEGENLKRAEADINKLRKLVEDKGPAIQIVHEFKRIFGKIDKVRFGKNRQEGVAIKADLKKELEEIYKSVDMSFYEALDAERTKVLDAKKDDLAKNTKKPKLTDIERKSSAELYGEVDSFFRDYTLDDETRHKQSIKKTVDVPPTKNKVGSKIFKEGFKFESGITYQSLDKALNDDGFIVFANEYAKVQGFDFNEKIESGDEKTIGEMYEKYAKARIVCEEIVNGYKRVISEKLNIDKSHPEANISEEVSLNRSAIDSIEAYIENLALNGGEEKINDIYNTIEEYKDGPEKIKEAEENLLKELDDWETKAGSKDKEVVKEHLKSKIAEKDILLNVANDLDKSVLKKSSSKETPIDKVVGAFPDSHPIQEYSVWLLKKLAEYQESEYFKQESLKGVATTAGALALWTKGDPARIHASLQDLHSIGFIKLGSDIENKNDANEHITIIANPADFISSVKRVADGVWLSRPESGWGEGEIEHARKVYEDQQAELNRKPLNWSARVTQVGALMRQGYLSKSEAGGRFGLLGRMFGTAKKIKKAAEKIRAEHQEERDTHNLALQKLEQLESSAQRAKHTYQILRDKIIADSTITSLVKESFTKEIDGQVRNKIKKARENPDDKSLSELNKVQGVLDRSLAHTETDTLVDHLVEPEVIQEIQKEIDIVFKDVLKKRVYEAIDNFEKDKNSGFDQFRKVLLKAVNNPLEANVRYGTAKGKDARNIVIDALNSKKDELVKSIAKQTDKDKKTDDQIRLSQISGLIGELNKANKNEAN